MLVSSFQCDDGGALLEPYICRWEQKLNVFSLSVFHLWFLWVLQFFSHILQTHTFRSIEDAKLPLAV